MATTTTTTTTATTTTTTTTATTTTTTTTTTNEDRLRRRYIHHMRTRACVPWLVRVAEFAQIFFTSALPVLYICWGLVPLGGQDETSHQEVLRIKLLTAPLCAWVYVTWFLSALDHARAKSTIEEVVGIMTTFALALMIGVSGGLVVALNIAWPTTILGTSAFPLALNASARVHRRIADEVKAQNAIREVDVALLHRLAWYLNSKRAFESSSRSNRIATAAASDEEFE